MNRVSTGLILAIRAYRKILSPVIGRGACRYEPSCSAYAVEALQTHGAIRGTWLSLRRISACHPYGRRPFHDPVPPAGS